MKQYPSISKKIFDVSIYAFDKLDGSNIRAEWTRKNGFYKFGSRRQLIDDTHETLGEAVHLIRKQEESLARVFKEEKWEQVTAFFEFYGESSFAGQHANEPHVATLIDVDVYKKGILLPRDFVDKFAHMGIPKVLYSGKANKEFQTSVEEGKLDGMTFEGVVCKGIHRRNQVIMFKIKNLAWVDKLKNFCQDNKQLFEELV